MMPKSLGTTGLDDHDGPFLPVSLNPVEATTLGLYMPSEVYKSTSINRIWIMNVSLKKWRREYHRHYYRSSFVLKNCSFNKE